MGIRTISVMGSTGSIGVSTLDAIAHANAQSGAPIFAVEALVGGSNVELLIAQARRHRPAVAVLADETQLGPLRDALAPLGISTAAGEQAVLEAASRPCDRLMAAIVGVAGLASTLAGIRAGADILLANKESMICASQLMKSEAKKHGVRILPVDSEHNAMFQVMERHEDIEKLILTASGGPFLNHSLEEMRAVTPAQAVAHPRWSMGQKISIDRASLTNKSLELIEASYLFDIPEAQIDVVVHPQSIIHSLVAYKDRSVLAQLGTPDMRTPIAHTLTWPDNRIPTAVDPLNLAALGTLDFQDVDHERFPAITLARQALRLGGGAPAILNCANEEAVSAFIRGECGFLDISSTVKEVLNRSEQRGLIGGAAASLDDVQSFEDTGRALAREVLNLAPVA